MARGSWIRLTRIALCLPATIAAVDHAVIHLPDRNLDAILHIQDLDDDGDETFMGCKAEWAAAAAPELGPPGDQRWFSRRPEPDWSAASVQCVNQPNATKERRKWEKLTSSTSPIGAECVPHGSGVDEEASG